MMALRMSIYIDAIFDKNKKPLLPLFFQLSDDKHAVFIVVLLGVLLSLNFDNLFVCLYLKTNVYIC